MLRNIGYPPLRIVADWKGRTAYRCDVCGCGVASDHEPGGEVCRLLVEERRHKHSGA